MTDKKDKSELMKKAKKLAKEYMGKYAGCAQSTFAAVADTLNLKGRDEVFKAIIGFSGGLGSLGGGTCGALAGAAAAISLSFNVTREELAQDKNKRKDIYLEIARLGRKFKENYGGISCVDVQENLYGKSFNLWDKEEYEEFGEVSECEDVAVDAAAWAVDIIVEAKKKPQRTWKTQ